MRKTWEILAKIDDLKDSDAEDHLVQKRLLNFVLESKQPANQLAKQLNYMYEITVDKKEISNTIDDLPFNLSEVLSASEILAWILEIPKKVHKKNKKAIEKIGKKGIDPESFLGNL